MKCWRSHRKHATRRTGRSHLALRVVQASGETTFVTLGTSPNALSRTDLCRGPCVFPGLVHAGDLTFTQSFVANFDFDVLGGTPINPGPATGFQPYEAIGALTFTLDSSINDPSQTTVPFTNVTGTLNGVYPSSLVPYTISPDVQFIGGDLTNIVRNGSGNVISADVSDLSMRWDLIAFGGGLNAFHARWFAIRRFHHIHSVLVNTVLSGASQFNVYLDYGGTDTTGGIWGESNPDRCPRAGLRYPGGSGSLGHGSRYGAWTKWMTAVAPSPDSAKKSKKL